MNRNRNRVALSLTLLGLVGISLSATAAQSATADAASKGAQVYCFMRSNGNNHEVSWTASYALIKRQGNSLFKTSPNHAAVLITEAVVNEPSSYPNCGQYLGDLFGNSKNSLSVADQESSDETVIDSYNSGNTNTTTPSSTDHEQHYSY